MADKIFLKPHLTRKSTFFTKFDSGVPHRLFETNPEKPCLCGFEYPLPSAKKDYTCFTKSGNVLWLGATTGLTRFDPDAEYDFDKVMFFSAERDLPDNNVHSVFAENDDVWVLTDKGVTKIEMLLKSPAEIAEELWKETKEIVDRRGMISQRGLAQPGNKSSAYPYGHSDNDGGFTAQYCVGEVFKYAYFKREKGIDAAETKTAKESATRALEACLLLMYIHGRGDGFVARSYVVKDEPLPDDGIFFTRKGDVAVCAETSESKRRGCAGLEISCSAPIPERLRHLLTDYGYTEDDVTYKADTSSDEITLHYLNLMFAHHYLTCDDKELDDIVKDAAKNIAAHILDHDLVLSDYSGKATTWAKWNEDYFNTEDGYVDACLNSAELLFYLKAVMDITGEEGRWLEAYNYLINERGYADLTTKHYDRMIQFTLATQSDFANDIMYGDHMLCAASFLGLCLLEKDEVLLEKYRTGFKSWICSIGKEYTPGYDFMYKLACPDFELDELKVKEWFARFNLSRLASGVSVIGRHDVPIREYFCDYRETGFLLPPDECFISKYDRNPLEYKDADSGGSRYVESCYVFTYAYWIGKYFGFIEE